MPLSKEQIADMKKRMVTLREQVKTAKADIAQAKRAGLDVSEHEKQLREAEQKMRMFTQAYGLM